MFGRLAEALFAQLNRVRVWHRMPTLPLRVANLLILRRGLRRLNLHDTQRGGFPKPEHEVGPEVYRVGRTADGSYNDLAVPAMGARGMRFGRNFADRQAQDPDAARHHGAESARGEPQAARAPQRRVLRRSLSQHLRRRLAAVHDARLVRPHARRSRIRTRFSLPTTTTGRARSARSVSGARSRIRRPMPTAACRRRSPTPNRTGGIPAKSTAGTKRGRRSSARAARGSSRSPRTVASSWTAPGWS